MALPFGVRQKPSIVEMPAQRMAAVRSVGDPNEVGAQVFPALFGAVYTLKFKVLKPRGVEFKASAPRARWPLPLDTPARAVGGPVGHPRARRLEADELPQTVPGVPVALETWEYGTMAHILHLGPYAERSRHRRAAARVHRRERLRDRRRPRRGVPLAARRQADEDDHPLPGEGGQRLTAGGRRRRRRARGRGSVP